MMAAVLMVAVLVQAESPLWGWERGMRREMVRTAIRVLPDDMKVVLMEREDEVVSGSSLEWDGFCRFYPVFDGTNIAETVDSELILLSGLRRELGEVTPYMAYRMGVLGSLVAEAVFPFMGWEESELAREVAARYASDVERRLGIFTYKVKERRFMQYVEPYFNEIFKHMDIYRNFIALDYLHNGGFGDYCRRSLGELFTVSVNAIADCWFTILARGDGLQKPLPTDFAKRRYLLAAMDYYIRNGDSRYVEATERRLYEKGFMDVQVRKRIADLYYEAGRWDEAVERYRKILSETAEDGGIKQRLVAYYRMLGSTLFDAGRLDEANEAYREVLRYAPGDETARQQRLLIMRMIEERKSRREQTQRLLAEAKELFGMGELRFGEGEYAEAIRMFRQARSRLSGVDAQFPEEYQEANSMLRKIEARLVVSQEELVKSLGVLDDYAWELMSLSQVVQMSQRLSAAKVGELMRKSYQDLNM